MTRITRAVWVLGVLGMLSFSSWAESDPVEDLAGFEPVLVELAEPCRLATVGVMVPGGSMGSGVIVSKEGLVLTAAHVLPEAGGEVVIVLADGRQVAGRALGVNRTVDSGMAQITEPGEYAAAPVAEGDTVWEGDWCVAFGHGGGVQTDRAAPMRLGRALHVTSATREMRWITSDCTVISGDSGGPLFDLEGRVIGIHSNIGMSVLVNRHVPISAYHAQWDELLEAGNEMQTLPPVESSVMSGFEGKLPGGLPDTLVREIARRLADGDVALQQALDASRGEDGQVALSPERAAELLGRADLIEEVRAYQAKLAERQRRTESIEQADGGATTQAESSEVSRRSEVTRQMILKKKRERMLGQIAEDLRQTHGKIAGHVLDRFEPAVRLAGASTAEVVCQGEVVALAAVVRADGYLVTKASELRGPARVRLDGKVYAARVVRGDSANDLALLKIEAADLTPVRWASQGPGLGKLLVVPNAEQRPLAMAVVGVDARPIPPQISHVPIGDAPVVPPEEQVDDRQSAAQVYSARGGALSDRRTDFPLALTHDAVVWAPQMGGPVLDMQGRAVGLNIARYGRTATYALPAEHVKVLLDEMLPGR